MRGLLYKDFVNAKGYIAVVVFYLFYVFVMVEAVALGFNNAVGLENKLAILSENYMILLSCIIVSCLIPTAMAMTICTLDNKTKWTNYALAMPGGYRAVVMEKYLIALIGDVVAVIASLATVAVVKHYFEVKVDGVLIEDVGTDVFIVLMLLAIGVSLVGNSIILSMICKNKESWLEIFFLVCFVIVVYALAAYMALGDISFFQQENLMEKIIMWIATHEKEVWGISYGFVGAGILAQMVSYMVTVKTYLKYT